MSINTKAQRNDERGVVAVLTAIMLVILVAAAGMAVDVGNWKLQASRQQNAADAAALGGVVFLPGDLTSADDIANGIAAQHGYDPTNSTVSVAQGAQANQLEVTIERTVENSFLSVIGVDSHVVTERAVAEYEAAVDMGSPDPLVGNDPEASPPNQAQYWLTNSGPGSAKVNGDRYSNLACGGATVGCTGSTNDEYDADGYFFGISVPAAMLGQPLSIQVYDGQMYAAGQNCSSSRLPDSDEREALVRLTDGTNTVPPGLAAGWYTDADDRYQQGASKWCTSDADLTLGPGFDTTTTFVFREPDRTPWNNFDNPIVGSCAAVDMPFFDKNLEAFDLLFPEGEPVPFDPDNPPDPLPGPYVETDPRTHGQHIIDPGDGVITFGETFRRWFTTCEIPANELKTGQYLLQMHSTSGAGHNMLSLRAGSLTSGSFLGNGVTVEAKGRLPISAVAEQATTLFSIARVLPGGGNRELQIELFDMGDATVPGTLTILPPAESNLSAFSSCEFEVTSGVALTQGADCSISGVRGSGFNGEAIIVRVPIPSDGGYTCTVASPTGCWVRVRAKFDGGVHDTTTWSASMNGDPVRLIE